MEEIYYSVGLVLLAICGAIVFVFSERRVQQSKLKSVAARTAPKALCEELRGLLGALENQLLIAQQVAAEAQEEKRKLIALAKSIRNANIALKDENAAIAQEVQLVKRRLDMVEDMLSRGAARPNIRRSPGAA